MSYRPANERVPRRSIASFSTYGEAEEARRSVVG
jgi:hypothetical protein